MAQLYAKVFTSILDSSLAEDWRARIVFMDMLLLADEGVVDITRQALSRRTNVPLEIINAAIEKLEAPDPMSRDPEHEGRRIIRIDGHRDWGWEIVNWDKYEEIRSAQDNLEKSRVKKRVQRSKVGGLGQFELPLPLELQPTQDASFSPHPSSLQNQNQNQNQTVGDNFSHNQPQVDTEGTQEGHNSDTKLIKAIDLAEEIYGIYPRKAAKPDALKAIIKALKRVDPGLLVSKTREFATAVADWDPEKKAFIPHPATWFNQDRFLDDPEVWKATNQAGNGSATNGARAWAATYAGIKALKGALANHPANPEFAGYFPADVTPEMKADYEDKQARLAELTAQL